MNAGRVGRAVRWPLWSWRNLTVTAVLALVLLASLGRLTNEVGASAAPAPRPPLTASVPTVPAATTTPSAPTTAGSVIERPSSTTPTKVTTGSPVAVATAFVTAWSTTTHGETPWLTGMKPWGTPSLISSLTGTDPAQVPATRVTGDAALKSIKSATATVSVPTDGGRIAVDLVNQSGTWKANTLAPDDAPPGAPTPSLSPATASSGS
ncbi:hypothetical protein [Pedococcus bigeumensis]|uniref:Uncharacterized protein n=1 Tax=Pedococcus bigeumensis TaxID=433644 RepID=A0A502CMB4_9MICO|nr:hypothetical protein [Pedococcus bigeumensis]TPG14038.1 hypothetical protein EAH86_17700 [Pedococcus bigeumensis]